MSDLEQPALDWEEMVEAAHRRIDEQDARTSDVHRLIAEVFSLTEATWQPEHRAVVEACWNALRSWPVEQRMEAMGMRPVTWWLDAFRVMEGGASCWTEVSE